MNSPHQDEPEPDGGKTGAKVAAGCGLGCLILAAIAIFGIVSALSTVQKRIDDLAAAATSEPAVFDYPDMQVRDLDALLNRFDAFREAMANDQPAEPLALTADDINVLINEHPTFEPLAGKAFVRFESDQIVSEVSIKPEDFPVKVPFLSKAFAGKYINGTATVDLSIKDGRAELYVLSFRLAEQEVPAQVMDQIKTENILETAQSDPNFSRFIEKVEELKVEEGMLYIYPKSKPDDEAKVD